MVEEKPQGETLVIDGHSHLGIPPDWMSPENFIKILDEARISQAVICRFSSRKDSLSSNQIAHQAVKRYPKRLIGCFWANPGEENIKMQIKEAVENWGFRMVKLHCGIHSVSEKNILKISRICEQLKIPLFIDIEQNFKILDVLLSYSNIPVILAHLGTGVYDLNMRLLSESLSRIKSHNNLWLDTSGTTYPLARRVIDRIGPDRLIFGSDAPHEHPGVQLCMIRYLHLSQSHLKKVLSGNIQKLLPPTPIG